MNTFDFVQEAIITALGWTLIHSLWQGTLIALVVFFLLPKIQRAKFKYLFTYAALLTLFLSSICTFCYLYSPQSNTSAENISTISLQYTAVQKSTIELSSNPWLDVQVLFSDWINAHATLLFSLWMLGFVFFLLRMFGGLWYLHRIRNTGLESMSDYYLSTLEHLKQKAGIKKHVQLAQSKHIDSPISLGHFKPLILFPIGLINQLTPEQVEAALAHELAHIFRNDFALNVLQNIIEALFYYHPAAWYFGQIIREEREHCCDDIAMDICQSPITYAKTLVEINSLQQQYSPQFAMALAGPTSKNQKSKLLHRVQRILNQPQQHNTQIMEKSVATFILLCCFVAWGMKAEAGVEQPLNENTVENKTTFSPEAEEPFAAIQTIHADTSEPKAITKSVEKRIEKYKREDGEKSLEMTMENGQITEIIENGEVVPKERYDEFKEDLQYFSERSGESSKRIEKRVIIIDDEDIEWEEGDEETEKDVRIIRTDGDNGNTQKVIVTSDGEKNTVQVSTKTDDDGNTTIVINNEEDNEKTQIQVIDGKVYMNGKEVTESNSKDTGVEKRVIVIDDETEEQIIEIDENGEKRIIVLDSDNMEDLEGRLEELADELGEHGEKIKIRVKEAMEGAEKNMRRIEVRIQEIEEEIETEIEERIEERRVKREKNELGYYPHDGDLPVAFRQKMIEDKIIGEGDDFKIVLTAKKLIINRKKQSAERHTAYMDLYEELKGKRLKGKDKVKINHQSN